MGGTKAIPTSAEEHTADTLIPLLPPSAALLVADDDAHFREVNAAALSLLGYSEPELKGLRVWDITVAPQRSSAQAMWKQFISQGHQAGVYQVRRADGRRITVQFEATANFKPGRHLSILRPVSHPQPESRPLDECPFERPFPVDFDRCPAYQPVLAQIVDSREQPVGQVWTCDHLAATRIDTAAAYYGRCGLGDAIDRSRWLTMASEGGMLRVRELRVEFYRAAEQAIGQLLAARVRSRSTTRGSDGLERLKAARKRVLVALAEFISRCANTLQAAGIDPLILRRAMESTLEEGLGQANVSGLSLPDELLADYPPAVQAFMRPDLVAGRMMRRPSMPR